MMFVVGDVRWCSLRRLDAQTKSRGSESEHKEVRLGRVCWWQALCVFYKGEEVDQEARLRIEFLECRDVFLTSLAQDFQMNRAYQSLVTLIKRNRESWFDTVTQYRTIFTPEGEESNSDDQGILSQWIAARVNEFLHKLNETLPLVEDAASIANLLDQVGEGIEENVCITRRIVDVFWRKLVEGWSRLSPTPHPYIRKEN